MKRHVFDRYFRKHDHYPRIQVDNGVQRLTVEFAPGYIRIKTSPPFGGEIYITAATARLLLKKYRQQILQLLLKQDRSFDVPKRVHQQSLLEAELAADRRLEKKARQWDPEKAERQKRRHQKARERALRREQGET